MTSIANALSASQLRNANPTNVVGKRPSIRSELRKPQRIESPSISAGHVSRSTTGKTMTIRPRIISHDEVERQLDEVLGPVEITNETISPELIARRIGTELKESELVVLVKHNYVVQLAFGIRHRKLKAATLRK
jgi:hypothetical protein